ncbi:hypothetical protein NUACC21_65930 [Scytonema sp. NUACC21]
MFKKISRSTEAGKQALANLLRRERKANLLTITDAQVKLREKGFKCSWSAIQELERPRQGQRLDWELINAIAVYLGYPRDSKGNRYTIRRLMLLAAKLEEDNQSETEPQSLARPSTIARRSTETGIIKLSKLFRYGRGEHSLHFVHNQLKERGFQTSYYSLEKIQYELSKIDWELVNAIAELGFFPCKTEELMLIAAEVSSPTLLTEHLSNTAREFTPHAKSFSPTAKIKSSLANMSEQEAVMKQEGAYRLTARDSVRLAKHLTLSATLQTGIVKICGEVLSRWLVETTGIKIALARKLQRGDEEGLKIFIEDLDAIARKLFLVYYWHDNTPELNSLQKYVSFEDYLMDLQRDNEHNLITHLQNKF